MSKTFIQAQADVASLTNDPLLAVGATNNALNQTLLNMGIHYVMNMADWNFNRSTIDLTSVASQQAYLLPYNTFRVNYINVYANGLWYTPREIKNDTIWRQINYVTTNYTDVPQYWYYSNTTGQVSIYPIPASAGNTIRVEYTKRIRDLSDTAVYATGTLATTANTATITGSGTSWTQAMVGKSLNITTNTTAYFNIWNEITTVGGTTSITVKNSYPATSTGASYQIAELIPFMEGFEYIAVWFACDKYYQMREMPGMAQQYEVMWKTSLEEMKARDQRSVNGILKKESSLNILDPNTDPWSISIT